MALSDNIRQYYLWIERMQKANDQGDTAEDERCLEKLDQLYYRTMTPEERKLANRPAYILSDQPETCRKCGARTTFEELGEGLQEHTCPACDFTYITTERKD